MSAALSRPAIDFGAVAASALANARHLLPLWFPMGRARGRSFCVGDLDGGRGESLCVSAATGQWIDFARPSDRGGDLVALNAARLRMTQADAARDICARLGVDLPLRSGNTGRRSAPARHRVALPVPGQIPQPPDEAQQRSVALALRVWEERRPLLGSPAQSYLCSRGVLLLEGDAPEDLAFHPRCPREGGTAPAMLALLRDARTMEPCGVHRTFIRPDGSGKDGDGRKAKMMLGRARGAVITVSPSKDVTTGLGVTEGIEDALTMLCRGWAPVWACGSASAIGGLPALAGVEALTIFGDNNDAGLDGARECAIRWADAGREVTVHIPHQDGADWNSLHTGRAAA